MLYILGICLIIFGAYFQRSKLIVAFQAMYLIIVMGGNTFNPDYNAYVYRYEISLDKIKSPLPKECLYVLTNAIAKRMALDFQQFHFIFFAILVIGLIYVIKKYTANVAPVLSMFIIYPMVECTIQIRTFAGMVLLLWACTFLLNEKDRYGTLKYLLIILIAGMFHVTFYFYVIFSLIRFFNFKSRIVIWQVGIAMVLLSIPVMPWIISKVFSVGYFSGRNYLSLWKVIGMAVWQLSGIILLIFIKKTKDKKIPLKISLSDYVLQLNLFISMIIPLYFGGNTFMRLYRNIFLLNYIYISCKQASLFKAIFIAYIICTVLFFNIAAGNGLNEVFRPIFENNIFLAA